MAVIYWFEMSAEKRKAFALEIAALTEEIYRATLKVSRDACVTAAATVLAVTQKEVMG